MNSITVKMEKIEQLYESGNYDSKKILNRSTKEISQDVLNNIENEGVTTEYLETLGVPVFKYKTQITIHGLFPELCNNYIGGYKHLIQNKNLSIGVKYNAIDFNKKKQIYLFCHRHSGWKIAHNSTEMYIYKISEYFSTKEEYVKILPKMVAEIKHVDKTNFIGETGVILSKSILGTHFLYAYILINSIKQENVIPTIENILSDIYPNILQVLKEKSEKEKEEFENAREETKRALKEKIEKEKPYNERAVKILQDAGFTYQSNVSICQDLVCASWNINLERDTIIFKIDILGKKDRQIKWRHQYKYSVPENELSKEYKFNTKSNDAFEDHKTSISGWIRLPNKPEIKKEEIPTKVGKGFDMVEILDYSEKAIAVVGEGTKAIKDQLKSLGGSFNFRLSCGPGWIFPKSKMEQIKKLLIENENA